MSRSRYDFLVRTDAGHIEPVKEVKGLRIRNFDPEEHFGVHSRTKMSPTILVNGKRGSGKSVFVRWLLGHLGPFPTAYAVVPTGKVDDTVTGCFPPVFREYDLVETRLAANHEKQKEKARNFSSGAIKDAVRPQDIRHIYVLDDCISQKDVLRRSKTINQVMLEGRHYFATFVLTSQDVNAPTPAMRQNFDWVFLLRTNSTKLLKTYYDYYADFFDTFDLFKEVFNEVTKDYGVMAINMKNQTGEVSDIVFRAKANADERPRLCLPQFWDPKYVAKLRKARELRKKREEERKVNKKYMPVTSVHRKVGYRIEYPSERRDSRREPRDPRDRPRVSFSDLARDTRY